MTAEEILDALIAVNHDKVWATELPFRGSSTRIDFWTLAPTKSAGFRAVAYEIKVSKSDFNRDTKDKQAGAIAFSDRFFYATPPGLVGKNDIPDWAGLMEWHGSSPNAGWKVVRKAPKMEKADPDWGVVVDIIRNSGQCRRDVSLLLSELAYYKSQTERQKRQENVRNGRFVQKALRRGTPRTELA